MRACAESNDDDGENGTDEWTDGERSASGVVASTDGE